MPIRSLIEEAYHHAEPPPGMRRHFERWKGMDSRTQRLGEDILQHLLGRGHAKEKALEITRAIIPVFGKEKPATDKNPTYTEQLAFIAPSDEDDYYTAVDDLKKPSEDAGAGLVGEAGFGSGVFYLYACIDRALLLKNLGGDTALAATALAALARAAATVSPRGKQNSFAAHGRAHYFLAEAGDAQPRTLAGAFAKPVAGDGLMAESIVRLRGFRAPCAGGVPRARGDEPARALRSGVQRMRSPRTRG